jgi:hypoxanthine phosphoribosyltransferase
MPDSEKAWAFLRDSDLITSAAEVQAAVDRVAAQIERALGKRYPLVLAVMGGAVVFAGQILPKLRFPARLRLRARLALRYRDARRGHRMARAAARDRERTRGAGAGRHPRPRRDHGGDPQGAARARRRSVHCAVLVEKRLNTEKPISADFVGLQIPGPLRLRLRNGRKGLLAQPAEIRAMKE